MKAKVCQSRKSMHTVMSNGGKAQNLTIIRNGVKIQVPEEWLFSDGRIKKYALKQINLLVAKQLLLMEEVS